MPGSKIFKRGAALLLSAAIISTILVPGECVKVAGMSKGDKFLGNIIGSSVPSDFSVYWNQVTPENACKWANVESSRDDMKWDGAETCYNYAKSQGMPFKFHTLIWGNQEPSWMSNGSLSDSEKMEEVIEWMQAAGERYGDAEYVDVVNEPIHAKPLYKDVIGGDGTTGWDWVIWSFEQARKYFKGKLLINEYAIISDTNATNKYIKIINLLKSRGLIDGIGIQCHQFNLDYDSTDLMKTNLDKLAETGLPIYVSELDLDGDDNTQLERYKEKFPVLWEHSGVKGITLWGYIEGQTYKDNTHLINLSGTERPALKWLKEYIATHGGNTEDTIIYGDLNGDEEIDAIDNALLKQYLLGIISDFPSANGKIAADLDKSGTIDALDFAIMKKYLLNVITSLPV
jgi:endo-1,4-beta-xylanase